MTPSLQPIPLLMTKLYGPRVQTDIVLRPRVAQRLDAGLDRRLTLVSAPAGFGKTTLVSSWLNAAGRDDTAVAWLSLDAHDNDATRFLEYLVEAFHMANPQLGENARILIRSAPNIQVDLAITSLINDIGSSAVLTVLVLDDYHVITNPAIHTAMDLLIEHQPPGLHVILTCRTDPPLALSKWRGRGEVVDIGAEDLRFTPEETRRFLEGAVGHTIAAEDILELEQRTEGWVTGLQLAAISMRDRDDIQTFIHSFSGQHHHIVDYLVDEVFNQQAPATQEFLLQTSLFDRFTAELCDAITGESDGRTMLEFLVRSNLFITSLDNDRRWFRYHQLFADLLRRRMRESHAAVIPELRRRASHWFEADGDLVEAIWQSIHGKDWERAGDLIEVHVDSFLNQGQSKTVLELTQALPNDVVQRRPWLLHTRAWALILNGQPIESWHDITDLGDLVERFQQPPMSEMPEAEQRKLRGSIAAAMAINSILDNDFAATLAFANDSLRQLPEGEYDLRSMVNGMRAQALWLVGDLQGAAEASWKTIELSKLKDAPLFRIIGFLSIASIDVEMGQLDRAAGLYEQAIDYAASRGLSRWQYTGRVLSFQSEIPYERNDLQQALELARRGRQIAAYWSVSVAYDITYPQLARVYYALGDLESARSVLEQAPPFANVGPGEPDVAQVEALAALIDLEIGDQARLAVTERDLFKPLTAYLDDIWLWTPALKTRAQVLNAIGKHRAAIAILDPLFDMCIDRGWTRQAIQTGAVLAASHHANGALHDAANAFDRILTYAEPHGFLRSVLDAGPEIASVIQASRDLKHAEGEETLYLDQLLTNARGERWFNLDSEITPQQPLIEPLSERELEVLRLIAAGHTNATIADELFVVVGTVKAHAHNIYSKLDVRNRTQAVRRARELGLID